MERLTFDGNFCDIAQCKEIPCPYNGACSARKVWERLKAYEDTGLTPEEIVKMGIAYEDNKRYSGRLEGRLKAYEEPRLLELAKADREGRVVVLPCKVGDTVWKICYQLNGKYKIEEQSFSLTYFKLNKFRKSFFLTREEAEKALEAMKDG